MSKTLSIFGPQNLREALVACREGNERAMYRVFQHYSPGMMGLSRRYLTRTDLAEEALSTAFAKAFDRMDSLRDLNQFEPWLKSIVVRECLNTLRREKPMSWSGPLEETAPVPAFDESALDKLAMQDLLALVDNLPSGYRTVFNLYVLEGYAHAEIADMLGITESTSKTQFRQAKLALQRMIQSTNQISAHYGQL